MRTARLLTVSGGGDVCIQGVCLWGGVCIQWGEMGRPPADRQTPVKTLSCPKLRLRAVKIVARTRTQRKLKSTNTCIVPDKTTIPVATLDIPKLLIMFHLVHAFAFKACLHWAPMIDLEHQRQFSYLIWSIGGVTHFWSDLLGLLINLSNFVKQYC